MPDTPDIITIPEAEFDTWYNNTPAGTATAEDLLGAKQAESENTPAAAPTEGDAKQPKTVPAVKSNSELPLMEAEDFETVKKADAAIPAALAGGEQKVNPETASPTVVKPDATVQNDMYKSMTDYLVQAGKWADFDGRAEVELNDETYGQLVERQDEYRLNQKWENRIAALGPYGKALLEYENNGGNAADLIDQFKAQKEAQQYNIDSKDGQLQFIRNYYQQELGWKKERVDKHILLLEMGGDEDLAAHATDLKADYDTVYNNRIEQMKRQQESFRQEQERKENEYSQAISQAIGRREDLSEDEKKYYTDFALKYNTRLPDGRMVNQAYVKLAQIQSDPDLYARFLEFIDNPEKFTQKISQQEQTKATKKAFQFVVGGKPKQASAHIETEKPKQFSFKGFV